MYLCSTVEGLVVYDDNFKVVARTEARRSWRHHYSLTRDDGSVEVGTTLHCTSSYGNFNRNYRYCVQFDSSYNYPWNLKCPVSTPTVTKIDVTSQLECFVWDLDGFYGIFRVYSLSAITIRVVRRGKAGTLLMHCC